jgi:hypothetical protein
MQSPPHDTSHNYAYQQYYLDSLSSIHSPNYLDHNGQLVDYDPGIQSPQVQGPTYGHSQDHEGLSLSYPS